MLHHSIQLLDVLSVLLFYFLFTVQNLQSTFLDCNNHQSSSHFIDISYERNSSPKIENLFHTQAIPDIDDFVRSSETDLEKCNITSLAHQWILCSEWVPSESKWFQSSYSQLTSCEAKSFVFVKKKKNPSLRSFNFKPLLLAKVQVTIFTEASNIMDRGLGF